MVEGTTGERIAKLEAGKEVNDKTLDAQALKNELVTSCIRNIERRLSKIQWLMVGLGMGLGAKTLMEVLGLLR